MAGFNFGFFGDQEHRVFNYKPRYYDPEKEERKAKFAAVDGTADKPEEEKAVPGSSIRGAFRGGNYARRRSSGGRVQVVIGFVTLLLIAVVLIYITKFYSLL